MKRATAFHDLKASDFPFTVEAYNLAGETVWSAVVAEPGSLHVPDLAREHGPIGVRVITPRGVSNTPPPA